MEEQGGRQRESLILRLKRKWFDAIAAGYKRREFREATHYWKGRIEDRKYTSIIFRNGFGSERPTLHVHFKGWEKTHIGGCLYYALNLGDILRMDNYQVPAGAPPPASCPPVLHDESLLTFSASLGVWVPRLREVPVHVERHDATGDEWEMVPRHIQRD